MKLWKGGGDGRKIISIQRSLRCVLPKSPAIIGMLAYMAILPLSGCEMKGGTGIWGEDEQMEHIDSSNFTINVTDINRISGDTVPKILTLDFFIYDSEGVRSLEHGWREGCNPGTVTFRSSKREKLIVAVANSPHEFNLNALDRYDSVENLEFSFGEDDTVNPIMTGECVVSPASEAELKLKPLMGKLILGEISNNMKGYVRLENPRIFLTDANACVKALQQDGFTPSETIEETASVPLPFDIGMFTQYPGTEVWCYPDEGDGTSKTSLVLECEIKGATRRFPVTVTPVGRNMTKTVVFSIDSADRYDASVY